MAADLPTAIVEFDAARPNPSAEFVLDVTPLDSSAGLAATPRWTTVAGIVSADCKRGRTDQNSPVQAGVLTLACDNASGDFDPDNPNGAFNQAPGTPYLVPGMACRVSVLWPSAGVNSPQVIYIGRLEKAEPADGWLPTATLTFVDDLAAAGLAGMTSFDNPVRAAEPSIARAAWLLRLVRLQAAPVLSSALTRQLVPTYGGGQVLDELEAVAAAEAGRVFADRFNRVTITAHADEYLQSPIVSLSDAGEAGSVQYSAPQRSTGRTQVVNAATVNRYDRDSTYPVVTAADPASIDRYGQTSVTVTAPLLNDGDAQSLATYYATRRSQPASSIDALTVDFAGQPNAAALLSADLGQRIVATRTLQYRSGRQSLMLACSIEGLAWSFSQTNFDLTIATAPVDASTLFGSAGAFRLNSSALSGADVLTPY